MNGDFIELYDWAVWKFGPFEYRICGYNDRDGKVRCIITEPVLGVNVKDQFVETTNKLKFKLHEPIQKSNMIDMMYILDRWMNINVKGNPAEATEMMLEALGRTESGKTVERQKNESLQTTPSKVKKDKSSTGSRKRSKKEE